MVAKRERSSSWSLAEISILTDLVVKNEEILKALLYRNSEAVIFINICEVIGTKKTLKVFF